MGDQQTGAELRCRDLTVVSASPPSIGLAAYVQEFMDGFSLYGCHTLNQISEKAQQWKKGINADNDEFKSFYYFVFNYLRGQKKILEMDSVELVPVAPSRPHAAGRK